MRLAILIYITLFQFTLGLSVSYGSTNPGSIAVVDGQAISIMRSAPSADAVRQAVNNMVTARGPLGYMDALVRIGAAQQEAKITEKDARAAVRTLFENYSQNRSQLLSNSNLATTDLLTQEGNLLREQHSTRVAQILDRRNLVQYANRVKNPQEFVRVSTQIIQVTEQLQATSNIWQRGYNAEKAAKTLLESSLQRQVFQNPQHFALEHTKYLERMQSELTRISTTVDPRQANELRANFQRTYGFYPSTETANQPQRIAHNIARILSRGTPAQRVVTNSTLMAGTRGATSGTAANSSVGVLSYGGQQILYDRSTPEIKRSWAPGRVIKNMIPQVPISVAIGYGIIVGSMWAECETSTDNPICKDEQWDNLSNPGLHFGIAAFALTAYGVNKSLFVNADGTIRPGMMWQILRSTAGFSLGLLAYYWTSDTVNFAYYCRSAVKNPDDLTAKAKCDYYWERLVVTDRIVEVAPNMVAGFAAIATLAVAGQLAQGAVGYAAKQEKVAFIRGLAFQTMSGRNHPVVRIVTTTVSILAFIGAYSGYSKLVEPYGEIPQNVLFSAYDTFTRNSVFPTFGAFLGWVTGAPITYLFGVKTSTWEDVKKTYWTTIDSLHEVESTVRRKIRSIWTDINEQDYEIYRNIERPLSTVPRTAHWDFAAAFRNWLARDFAFLPVTDCIESGELYSLTRFLTGAKRDLLMSDEEFNSKYQRCKRPLNAAQALEGYTQAMDLWREKRWKLIRETYIRWIEANIIVENTESYSAKVYRAIVNEAIRLKNLPPEAPRDIQLTEENLIALDKATAEYPTESEQLVVQRARTPRIVDLVVASAVCGPIINTNAASNYKEHKSFKLPYNSAPTFTPPRLMEKTMPGTPDICAVPLSDSSSDSNVFQKDWGDPSGNYVSLLEYAVLNVPKRMLEPPPVTEEVAKLKEPHLVHFDNWWTQTVRRYFRPVQGRTSNARTYWQDQAERYRQVVKRLILPALLNNGLLYCETSTSLKSAFNTGLIDLHEPGCSMTTENSLAVPSKYAHRLASGFAYNLRDEYIVLATALKDTYRKYDEIYHRELKAGKRQISKEVPDANVILFNKLVDQSLSEMNQLVDIFAQFRFGGGGNIEETFEFLAKRSHNVRAQLLSGFGIKLDDASKYVAMDPSKVGALGVDEATQKTIQLKIFATRLIYHMIATSEKLEVVRNVIRGAGAMPLPENEDLFEQAKAREEDASLYDARFNHIGAVVQRIQQIFGRPARLPVRDNR